jgi:ABC-type multidrug transport system fused ATPase/permease subunit
MPTLANCRIKWGVVVVVKDGRISEYGMHAELLRAGGAYARLWNTRRQDSAGVTG